MKILQIINNLGSGGAEKLISDFVPLMRDKGHEVEVLLLQKQGSIYIDDLKKQGIKVTCLSENKLYALSHVFNIRKFIKEGKFDVVNVHLFPTLYYLGFLSLIGLIKAKLIYTRHYTKSARTNNAVLKIVDGLFYKGYDKIIAITDSVKNSILEEEKVDDDIVDVVVNGVDVEKFSNSKPSCLSTLYSTYKNNHKIITMVGRFSETKDQSTLIKAVQLLNNNINLIFVGEGALMDKHKKLVNDLGIEKRVHFLGMRRDVNEILKASDIGVLSTKLEGMPVSVLEIFSSGIPFAGSKVAGINDLFKGFDSSYSLFNYKDVDGLKLILENLFNDKNFRKRNIEISQKIVSNFSLEKMVDGYLKTYSSLF